MSRGSPGYPLSDEEYEKAMRRVYEEDNGEDGEDQGPEDNYVHTACGTTIRIEGGHKVAEFAWCEEAGSVVRFTRIER